MTASTDPPRADPAAPAIPSGRDGSDARDGRRNGSTDGRSGDRGNGPTGGRSIRGQSNVVGVAVLLGITMLSLGTLTAGIGAVVQENAAAADADRVAADLDDALEPVAATGPRRGRVSFTGGRLSTTERTVRVLNGSGVVADVAVGGLVFESDGARVAYVAGAVVRGTGEGARLTTRPPITAGEGVLIVGAAKLNASGPDAVAASRPATVALRTNVSHDRRSLGEGEYRVAVETEAPAAWETHFAERGATTTRRDFDGDGTPSVVADLPGERRAHFVVHDMRTEVARG